MVGTTFNTRTHTRNCIQRQNARQVMSDWRPHLLFWHRNRIVCFMINFAYKSMLEVNLPRLRNFGCLNLPSNTSQYGETNARNIKMNAITVKLTAIRKFLLCTPILLQSNDDSY